MDSMRVPEASLARTEIKVVLVEMLDALMWL